MIEMMDGELQCHSPELYKKQINIFILSMTIYEFLKSLT